MLYPHLPPALPATLPAEVFLAQTLPNQCDLSALETADPIDSLFSNSPIHIVNDTAEGAVARRLGYYFSLDSHLQQSLEAAFTAEWITALEVHVVSQQELYQVQAEAQNAYNGETRQAMIRLSDEYVIGDYGQPCSVSLAAIENEFSEVVLRARYYATYGRALQPSVYQEAATLAVSRLISLLLQGVQFTSAAEVQVVLQDNLALSRRSYASRTPLSNSSPELDSAVIAEWLNERLTHFLPAFPDGKVEFRVDATGGRGNLIRPMVTQQE